MQQQQPSSIIRQRLALRARSRMALCAMLAALILGPKCRASAEESDSKGRYYVKATSDFISNKQRM